MATAQIKLRSRTLLLATLLLATLLPGVAPAAALAVVPFSRPTLERTLEGLAPDANPRVLRLAAKALDCVTDRAHRLAVIDYSLPSNQPRLWVFDLLRGRLLFEERVAHGRGSGDAQPHAFSNVPESHQSSLGLFRTLDSYRGRNGYSLRLEGLEPGVNDRAFDRAIVVHGADYASPAFVARTGRLGRSHGCPVVRPEVTRPLIDSIKGGQYLFAYYPDPHWLQTSSFLGCSADARLARN